MSTRSGSSASGQKVPPAVLAAIVVVLIAFVAWRGWATFAPPPEKPLPPFPKQEVDLLTQKAKECQGVFSKLSAEDQSRVQEVSHGFGAATMASYWRDIQQGKDPAKPPR